MTLAGLIDFVGATGAVLTTLCWLPQALKVIREKETRALSLPATVAFSLGVVLWLVYGLAIGLAVDRLKRGNTRAHGPHPGDEAALRLAAITFTLP